MARLSLKTFKQKYGAFILLGAVVFFIGLILNFPIHRLAPLAMTMIEKNTGYQISASQIHVTMPPGIAMEDVHVQGPAFMGIAVNHTFSSVKLYPSIMSLLTYLTRKSLGVRFNVHHNKERWLGTVAHGPKFTDLSINAKNLDYTLIQRLDQFNAMLANQTLSLTSKFNIGIDFASPTKELMNNDFTKAKASIKMRSKDSTLENAMIGNLEFDDTAIIAKLNKGLLTIEDIHLTGEKLVLEIEGNVNLQKSIMASKIGKADIKLFVDPSLEQLVGMVSMVGSINQLSFADDSMSFRISGPINNVQKWRVTAL